MPRSPEQNHTIASLAALESWARTDDRAARTQPAREARWQRYLEQAAELAPEGSSPEEVERRAEYLRRADMKRMALASVRARQGGGATDA